MSRTIIDPRDPIALFDRIMIPVAEQIHAANLALAGWVAHECEVLESEIRTLEFFNRRPGRGFEVRQSYDGNQHIGVSTLCGAVDADHGVGVIFEPKVRMDIHSDDGNALDLVETWEGKEGEIDGKEALLKWLRHRYPKAAIGSNRENRIFIEFSLEQNKIAAQ